MPIGWQTFSYSAWLPRARKMKERLLPSLAVIPVSLSVELLLACGMCWWRVRGSLGTWRSLGWSRAGVAMVHCRMSPLGSVVGGAETVVHPKLVHHLLGHASITMTLTATRTGYRAWEDMLPTV